MQESAALERVIIPDKVIGGMGDGQLPGTVRKAADDGCVQQICQNRIVKSSGGTVIPIQILVLAG